ncbi:MAG TPA: hypothetical protein VLT16_14755, partial [Candidatus Limnocylindrales bacterium]|nr:hypothetical protein [Candidatus Limnocylindrales bacterium]
MPPGVPREPASPELIAAPAAPAPAGHSEYERRLQQRQALARDLQRKHLWTGNVRVALFLAILVLGWWIAKTGFPSVYWLGACAGAFVALAIVHRRILRAKSTAERAAALYRRGIARIEDRWAGAGDTGEQFHDPEHVYAGDLDIFGE